MIPSLPLGYAADQGEPVLVRAVDCLARIASGRRKLPREEARWLFERAASYDTDLVQVRRFAREARLVDDLWRVRNCNLRERLLLGIDRGELVAVSPDSESAAGPVAAQSRRLADDIDSALSGSDLRLGGATYALRLGVDLPLLPDRRSFVALPRLEATRLLSAMQPGMPETLRILLERAREMLAGDAPSPEPDRFVLLRRRTFVAPLSRVDQPALTPSQLRETMVKTWIEIEVAFDDGKPYSGSVEVCLADGRTLSATTNARGILRLDGIVPGTCEVSFPGIDASSWGPA